MAYVDRREALKLITIAGIGLFAGCGGPTSADQQPRPSGSPAPVAAPRPLENPITQPSALAVSPEPVPTQKAPVLSSYRRAVGTWTQPEVEALAQGMIDEDKLPAMSYAGEILLASQRGEPSFSRLTPIFSDSKVVVSTVKDFPYRPLVGDLNIPVNGEYWDSSDR